MPKLSEVQPAMMERLLCIHFPVTFTDLEGAPPTLFRRQCDKGLKAKLQSKTPEILKWFVDGAVAWYASKNLKASAPEKVRDFGRAYFEEQDQLAMFIRDHCRLGDQGRVSTRLFLQRLEEACGGTWEAQAVASAMKAKGFEKKPLRVDGQLLNCYVGLELRDWDECCLLP
jgi:phage/plasmid-associated DNA primase